MFRNFSLFFVILSFRTGIFHRLIVVRRSSAFGITHRFLCILSMHYYEINVILHPPSGWCGGLDLATIHSLWLFCCSAVNSGGARELPLQNKSPAELSIHLLVHNVGGRALWTHRSIVPAAARFPLHECIAFAIQNRCFEPTVSLPNFSPRRRRMAW